jgi:hypothetical protein
MSTTGLVAPDKLLLHHTVDRHSCRPRASIGAPDKLLFPNSIKRPIPVDKKTSLRAPDQRYYS